MTSTDEPYYHDDGDQAEGEPDCGCQMHDCPQCNTLCHYCDGDGYGTVGIEFPCDDPLWEAEGTFKKCPCCHGSGKAKDCTFW